MIGFLKENYLWIGAIIIPVLVALIGLLAHLIKKQNRKMKIGDIDGDGNIIINGDVK